MNRRPKVGNRRKDERTNVVRRQPIMFLHNIRTTGAGQSEFGHTTFTRFAGPDSKRVEREI